MIQLVRIAASCVVDRYVYPWATAVSARLHRRQDIAAHRRLSAATGLLASLEALVDRHIDDATARIAEHRNQIQAHSDARDLHAADIDKALILKYNINKLVSEKL